MMLNLYRQDDTNYLTPPALLHTEIPAGLIAIGEAVEFFYGPEVVASKVEDADGFVTFTFESGVEPALYAAFDPVPVLRPNRRRA